ncbi:MAG: acyl-CoA desaturase [Planctomycetes bacterium]|nr:acyl-CoA desaturase [Planctomycetota bacterium]
MRVARWVDSAAGGDTPVDDSVDWIRLIPFLGMHALCLLVFVVGVSPGALLVALGLYLLRMFALTAFYHRYFAHRAFTTSRAMQLVFAVIGSAAAQRGPLWWAAHHRRHHRHSDTEEDAHSPLLRGFWWSHVGWFACSRNFRYDRAEVRDLTRYPELVFLDRFSVVAPLALALALYLLGGAQYLVWGFFVGTVLLYHVTFLVNSLAHRFGRQTYATGDSSRNSFLLAILTMGEGWHNNHHRYPGAARQGFRWWEVDLTYYILLALEKLRLVRDLRPVPASVVEGP